MPLHSRKNQYIGINAHLNSALQDEVAGWEGFHGSLISHLAELLDRLLPAGYLVDIQQSLQLREYHPDTGEPIADRAATLKPDLLVRGEPRERALAVPDPSHPATRPAMTLSVADTLGLDPALYLSAISVRVFEAGNQIGDAVTWIEILSPSNKPGGSGFWQYVQKRADVLRGGLALVEVDYIHERPPVLAAVPDYTRRAASGFPFTLIVSDPHPDLIAGQTAIYGFRVDDPIPTIDLPLRGEDTVRVDFGAAYNETFAGLRAYSARVDYEQLPTNFDRYDATDQARIQARMAAVADAQRRGVDLETGPFPLPQPAS